MMHREQLEMLKEIQALEFTAFDFNLYLDTHPNDQRVLVEYSRAICESERVKNIYIVNYGPLMAEDNVNQTCWRWIEDPWPWEIEY
jgi:spore coat protein JB